MAKLKLAHLVTGALVLSGTAVGVVAATQNDSSGTLQLDASPAVAPTTSASASLKQPSAAAPSATAEPSRRNPFLGKPIKSLEPAAVPINQPLPPSASKASPTVVATVKVKKPAARQVVWRPPTGFTQMHYGSPLRDKHGRINADATLRAVKARGSNIYSYLIYQNAHYNSYRDWKSLPYFLSRALQYNVAVQVMLTPPSAVSSAKHKCSADLLAPYRGNYDAWMVQIGKLAKKYPNLISVGMDDYAYSSSQWQDAICKTFKPKTLTRWNTLLTGHAKRTLRTVPVLYHLQISSAAAIYPKIKEETPEIVWPFTKVGTPEMSQQYQEIRKAAPHARIIIMVYAAPYRSLVVNAKVVSREIKQAKGLRPAGLAIYQEKLKHPA